MLNVRCPIYAQIASSTSSASAAPLPPPDHKFRLPRSFNTTLI